MLGRLFDGPQILIVIFIIVLIFAAPKLPGLAKNLGKSMKIFKNEVKNLREDDDESESETSEPQRPIEGNVVDDKRDTNSSGNTASSKTTPHSDS